MRKYIEFRRKPLLRILIKVDVKLSYRVRICLVWIKGQVYLYLTSLNRKHINSLLLTDRSGDVKWKTVRVLTCLLLIEEFLFQPFESYRNRPETDGKAKLIVKNTGKKANFNCWTKKMDGVQRKPLDSSDEEWGSEMRKFKLLGRTPALPLKLVWIADGSSRVVQG